MIAIAGSNLGVDILRLLNEIETICVFGRQEDGSCCRPALSNADRQGRDQLVAWMIDLGLDVRIDRIGNIIGLLPGLEDVAPVMIGSHLDTVTTGGRFDGLYGVIAGLEVIRTLKNAGVILRRPIAICAFTNEEGVRFQPDMMGSLVYAGGLPLDAALSATDHAGVTLGEELARIGYEGNVACGSIVPHTFVELHIEQGPILDLDGGVLGAVENLQGISWQEITIQGVSNHAGTTPMRLRCDAGYCAARVAVFARDLARSLGGSQVATSGSFQLEPGLINVIPRKAVMSIDLRNTEQSVLQAAEAALQSFLVELARDEGVTIEVRSLVRTQPVQFDHRVLQVIESVAADLGQPIRRMTSGAGHDAQMMARICPTAMIFVPSIAGVSHNPREDTRVEHLEIGANVLLGTVIRLASV